MRSVEHAEQDGNPETCAVGRALARPSLAQNPAKPPWDRTRQPVGQMGFVSDPSLSPRQHLLYPLHAPCSRCVGSF